MHTSPHDVSFLQIVDLTTYVRRMEWPNDYLACTLHIYSWPWALAVGLLGLMLLERGTTGL